MTLTDLANESYISLTTYKRDGTPVSTPVWVAGDDGRLLVHSAADTWKVKRIRRNGHVRVAACTAGGRVRGETFDGTAKVVSDTARVEALEARKYGLVYRAVRGFNTLVRTVRRRPVPRAVTIEIAPGAPRAAPDA